MNLEKFTDRAKGFLQSAQTVAIRQNHQRMGIGAHQNQIDVAIGPEIFFLLRQINL